jgi:type VI secretion system protein ImpE
MTTKAKEHYEAGRLSEAIAAQAAEVKSNPANTDKRGFLCELLTFGDNLDRVDKHLDVMGRQDPKIQLGLAEFRQIVRAEQARRDCFESGAVPDFIGDPTPPLQLHLRALAQVREGDEAGAAALLAEAEETRPRVAGTCDGEPFDDLRDLDDLTASFFEVLTTTGKYFWIPVEQVVEVEFAAPQRARDIVWRQAQMTVRGGPDGVVYVPCLYPGSWGSDDEQLRLGRATDWSGGEGAPVRGAGQRMLLVGEDARSMLEISRIEFAAAAGDAGAGSD